MSLHTAVRPGQALTWRTAMRRLTRGSPAGRPPLWLWLRWPAVAAAAALPLLLPSAHTQDLGRVAATDGVLALGAAITVGLCGQLCVAQAALFGTGAYATALLTAEHGATSLAALAGSVLCGALAGTLLGAVAMRVGGDQLAVVTLFCGVVVQQVMLAATSLTGGETGVTDIPATSLLGHDFLTLRDQYLLAAGTVLAVVVLVERLRRSPLGLSMIAVRENEVAARAAGVRVGAVKVVAFALSGAVSGLAGWLYAPALISISPPDFDLTLSVLVLVMVLLPGPGRIYGALVGAGFVATLQNELRPYSSIEEGLTGLVILLVALHRGGALRGGVLRLRRAVAR